MFSTSLVSSIGGAAVAFVKIFTKSEDINPGLCPNVEWNQIFHQLYLEGHPLTIEKLDKTV